MELLGGWLELLNYFLKLSQLSRLNINFLKFEYCNGLLKLSQESKLSTVLLEFNQVAKSWKSISDVLKLSLLQFDYYIQTNNLTKSKERYTGILTTLKRKPEFNMATSSELPLIQKFNNFLIIGKFQLLSSKLNQKLHKPIDAYVNVKTSIQILYSILKKCPNNVLRSSSQELIWEIYQLLSDSYKFIIELSIELGISRNIPFYLHEWEKLLDGVENPIVNCIHYTDIGNYGSRMNSDEFVECIQKAQECSRISKEYHEMDNANGFKDTLITCMKQELANCIEDISSITSLHNLTDSVQFLPGLLGESNTPCPKEILDRLVGLKNQIIQNCLSQIYHYLRDKDLFIFLIKQYLSCHH